MTANEIHVSAAVLPPNQATALTRAANPDLSEETISRAIAEAPALKLTNVQLVVEDLNSRFTEGRTKPQLTEIS